jgi:opacity protein-like surface antigen
MENKMKQTKLLPALFVALLTTSGAAIADDDSGFYAGIGFHRSDFNTGGVASASTKANLSAGYMFNDRLGVDATFYNFEDSKYFDVSSLTVSGVYKYPITEMVDLYGKLGIAHTRLKVTHPDIPAINATGTDLLVGIGAKVDFGNHNVFIEYDKLDPSDADLKVLQLGYRYEF